MINVVVVGKVIGGVINGDGDIEVGYINRMKLKLW